MTDPGGNPQNNAGSTNPQANANPQKSIRDRVIAGVSTVLTIFLTAYLTGLYSSRDIKETITAQQQQWVAQKKYDVQVDLLKRRFDLLDRFLKISRRQEELDALKAKIGIDLDQVAVAQGKKDATLAYQWIRQSAEDSNRFDDLKGEYIAVLNLAAMLFGDKTRAAVSDIVATHNPDIWNASELQIDNMANAMSAEMFTDLGEVPGKSGQTFRAEAKLSN
jgi:hypothetical protein